VRCFRASPHRRLRDGAHAGAERDRDDGQRDEDLD
jgi:hypothetical protein